MGPYRCEIHNRHRRYCAVYEYFINCDIFGIFLINFCIIWINCHKCRFFFTILNACTIYYFFCKRLDVLRITHNAIVCILNLILLHTFMNILCTSFLKSFLNKYTYMLTEIKKKATGMIYRVSYELVVMKI